MSAPVRVALLVAGSALVMLWRAPVYVAAPSFWAEEGLLFYAPAWTRPWWATLTAAPAGYLLLYPNVSALLALAVPVAHAPIVMKLLALGAQLLPVGLIASSDAPLWEGRWRRELGVLAVIFASLSDEIWLSTINSQTYFSLAAALVLLDPPPARRGPLVTSLVVLALCGLGSPVACFLAPLFVWRTWRAPERGTLAQAAVSVACAAVQAAVVLAAVTSSPVPSRLVGLSVPAFAFIVWMKALVLPTLGVTAANGVSHLLAVATDGDLTSRVAIRLGALLLALGVVVLGWLARGGRQGTRGILLGSYALVTTLSILFAVGDKSVLLGDADTSSRYFYVPGVLLLLLLLDNVRPGTGVARQVRRVVCGALLLAGLAGGMARYRSSVRWRPTWPVWREQVASWEQDPRRPLAIWPPGWQIRLPPRGDLR